MTLKTWKALLKPCSMNFIILKHFKIYYWEFICYSIKAGISEVLRVSQALLPGRAELHNRAQIIPVLKKTHYSSQVPAWEPSKDNCTIVHLKTDLGNQHSGIKYSWVKNNCGAKTFGLNLQKFLQVPTFTGYFDTEKNSSWAKLGTWVQMKEP